jgi:hypothetical protein
MRPLPGGPAPGTGGNAVTMEPISVDRAIEIARRKGLKPATVKGTDGIQFTNGKNNRLVVIDWEEFKRLLAERKLQVFESGGWMKIQKSATARKKR